MYTTYTYREWLLSIEKRHACSRGWGTNRSYQYRRGTVRERTSSIDVCFPDDGSSSDEKPLSAVSMHVIMCGMRRCTLRTEIMFLFTSQHWPILTTLPHVIPSTSRQTGGRNFFVLSSTYMLRIRLLLRLTTRYDSWLHGPSIFSSHLCDSSPHSSLYTSL